MENNYQLTKFEGTKIIEIISKIPNLTENDRHELMKKIGSDDVELRKTALEKITQSQIAQNDLFAIMGELTALNKKSLYVKAKQTIQTGSGNVEIEIKGGDTKLIIPVLVIFALIIISGLVIFFWE